MNKRLGHGPDADEPRDGLEAKACTPRRRLTIQSCREALRCRRRRSSCKNCAAKTGIPLDAPAAQTEESEEMKLYDFFLLSSAFALMVRPPVPISRVTLGLYAASPPAADGDEDCSESALDVYAFAPTARGSRVRAEERYAY